MRKTFAGDAEDDPSTSWSATTTGARQRSGVSGSGPWEFYTRRQRWTYLSILFLVATSNYVDRNIVAVLLEPIKQEFGASDAMLGLMTGFAFALLYATLGLPVAHIADRRNRKHVITVALIVWSVMTALCGMAQSFWLLVAARVGVGAGEAGGIPPSQSLIADYFQPEQRARALAIFTLAAMLGYILGLVVGGRIAEDHGWRAAFLAVGIPGLLLAVATHLMLQEPRTLAQFRLPADRQESASTALRSLAAKPAYISLVAALVFYFLMSYGAFSFTVSFMIRAYGKTVAEAGAAFGTLSGFSAVLGMLGGAVIADRLTKRCASGSALVGAVGLFAAFPLYAAAFFTKSWTLMIVLLFVAGIFMTAALPAMWAAVHLVCGSSRRAMAVAVAFFFANLFGTGVGPLVTGLLSDALGQALGAADGLRFALIIALTAFLPAGFFMLRAARRLEADLEA